MGNELTKLLSGLNAAKPVAATDAKTLAKEIDAVKAAEADMAKWENVEFVREGTTVVLPDGMSYDTAITWMQRRKKEEEILVAVAEQIDAYPFDGAYAFYQVMLQRYGFVQNMVKKHKTMGGEIDQPVVMIGIDIGYGKTAQVPWGYFEIPGVEGEISCGVGYLEGGFPCFQITGQVKQRHRKEVAALAEATREFVRKNSIYRGKAVRVTFPRDPDDNLYIGPQDSPKFLDISSVKEEELIFPHSVQELIDNSLFTPIEYTQACRENQIPLKRGVLLEGPYGVGKTLTAYVTAKKCEDNGWTFIYLQDLDELATAIRFAKKYSPAVIFAEDLDSVIDEERDDDTNDILNTIDGVDSKGSELIVVLTTNHVEDIGPAMMRPGRLDAVIPVRAPDAEAATRLVSLYSRGLLLEGEGLDDVGRKLAGQIPAVIREVVERSKLAAIRRLRGDTSKLNITAADLMSASDGMLAHLKLIEEAPRDERSEREKASAVLADAVDRLTTVMSGTKNGSNGHHATSEQKGKPATVLG